MAGGRRRVANKAKVQELSLGDLVLAKVKGFPAWPAKISWPEDWDQDPDPKKYFVQFFGTQEIAFVAPGDIQAFTSETKSKLLARSQAKSHKYFAQAVEEIFVAFEDLQKDKSSSLRDDTDRSRLGCEVSSADHVEDDGAEVDANNATVATKPNEQFTIREGDLLSHKVETDNGDTKPSVSGPADDGLSPVISSEGKRKISNGPRIKEEVLSTSSLDDPSNSKEDVTGNKTSCIDCSMLPSNVQKKFTDSQKPKKVASGSKRRSEDVVEGHNNRSSVVTPAKAEKSNICVHVPAPEEQLKDGVIGKVSGNRGRSFSSGALKTDSNYTGGRKGKDLLKAKRNPKVSDVTWDTVASSKGKTSGKKKSAEPGLEMPKSGTDEILHPAKMSKCTDMKNDVYEGSHGKNMKNHSPSSNNDDDKAAEHQSSKE
ncbi:hypothetical protein SLE2022_142010 [Rubroshorea leprosula]